MLTIKKSAATRQSAPNYIVAQDSLFLFVVYYFLIEKRHVYIYINDELTTRVIHHVN